MSMLFFRQYYLGCLSHASYLVGDTVSGAAVVVDPQRDTDQYLADATANGLALGATNPAAKTVQNQPQTANPAENAQLRGPLFDERARIRQKLHDLASQAVVD